jgi:hypothetical protein
MNLLFTPGEVVAVNALFFASGIFTGLAIMRARRKKVPRDTIDAIADRDARAFSERGCVEDQPQPSPQRAAPAHLTNTKGKYD